MRSDAARRLAPHITHSAGVYDLAAAVTRRRLPDVAARRRAFAAPLALWRRVLGFEGCAATFGDGLSTIGLADEPPPELRALLQQARSASLRSAVLIHRQLPAIAALATEHDVAALVLKGAARVLDGQTPGRRSIADIDLLVRPGDATRFHELLQRELGYTIADAGAPHHLPGLTRPGCLGIEVHVRLGDVPTPLDEAIWKDARSVPVGSAALLIPAATPLLLHTLEHAAALNWNVRYRLRDVSDVAELHTGAVSASDLRAFVTAHPERHAMETLLSAAHEIEPRIPCRRPAAWRTIRRVSVTRLTLATGPRERLVADRVFRYAGVVAEGSPRAILRAGLGLARRLRAGMAVLPLVALAACSDPSGSTVVPVPAFLFTSNAAEPRGIYRFADGVVTRLSAPGDHDINPHSAAGRVVFTSHRDGNAEVYSSDLELGGQLRLTSDPWSDTSPALHPEGGTIAFVSNRSGAPRLWLMDSDGTNQRPLETGSATFVPEGSPAWSPSGDRLSFTSTRTGTSQVFVVASGGGQAVQLSHEATGAFLPAWTGDGNGVLFTTEAGRSTVRVVPRAGGDWRPLASTEDPLRDGACIGTVCLAVAGAEGDGDIVFIPRIGGVPRLVVGGVADTGEPAVLVR